MLTSPDASAAGDPPRHHGQAVHLFGAGGARGVRGARGARGHRGHEGTVACAAARGADPRAG
eukprot:14737976-Heterocapsa_arctica.AAC.1